MNILVVVQARTSSTRLPGKVLLPVAEKPLLFRMLERLKAAKTPTHVLVATTWESVDDPIVAISDSAGVGVARGHPTDLLERHILAARTVNADAVVKIPSDCPLIDPAVVDEVIEAYIRECDSFDYVSNLHPATWPDGYDVEVMSRAAIELAGKEAALLHHREHTTPFIWDNPGRFRIKNISYHQDLSMTHRLTIDYQEDYELIAAVYSALYREGSIFSLNEILAFLENHPEIFALNSHYAGVNWYRHHLGELKTIDASQTRLAPGERNLLDLT